MDREDEDEGNLRYNQWSLIIKKLRGIKMYIENFDKRRLRDRNRIKRDREREETRERKERVSNK